MSVALFCVSCFSSGGDGGAPFGLSKRVTVEGLTFPVGFPDPTPLEAVVAFPHLSFDQPVFLTHAPDGTDRIFVVEQAGRIHVFRNDADVAATQVFLDITASVRGEIEQGLLGLAFHPDFAVNGFFYVYYTRAALPRTRVALFAVGASPDAADPGSETVILEFDQPAGSAVHKGGMLAFGADGMLYISSGDGGGGGALAANAQNLTNLLGKILRIDPSAAVPANPPYEVPSDNPFVGVAGVRDEIWAYGVRNPWRFTFDRNTGDLWLGDVGQDNVEEIDLVVRGGNYGWPLFEGSRDNNDPDERPLSSFSGPVLEYDHSVGRAIIGGYVYRGSALTSFFGAYIYADAGSDQIWALVHDGDRVVSNTEIASVGNPSAFGEDAHGELYVCSHSAQRPTQIYRFEESEASSDDVGFPDRLSETGLFDDTPSLSAAPGLIAYEVNSPLWSDGARKRRWIALPGTETITFHATDPWEFPVGTAIVKHFEIDTAPGEILRLETRVLIRHDLIRNDAGWQGYTYRWNEEQTDAFLLVGAETGAFRVDDPGAAGGQGDRTWYFPSRTDCLRCHTQTGGPILGVRTLQLNGDFAYPSAVDNQLRAWNHIGLFDVDIGDLAIYDSLPDPADSSAAITDRARSYLAANCAQCHHPFGPTSIDLDFRFDTPATAMNAVGAPATTRVSPLDSLRIDPGSKETSVVWELMQRLEGGRMPPLATTIIDEDAVELIGLWIDGL